MYLKALGRLPTDGERKDARVYVADLAEDAATEHDAVLQTPEVWSRFAHALFNFKEFLYVR